MSLPYIDIHTHLQKTEAGIFQLFNHIVGKDDFPSVICSTGIHPWYMDKDYKAQLKALELYASQPQVLAIGECGLDKICDTDWTTQIEIFENQIQLANTLQKPLIIHCVRAYQEIFTLLKAQKVIVPVVFHGFNKKKELADSILQQGYFISLGTSILHGQLDEWIKTVDLNKIFFETDDKSTNIVDIYSYFCGVRKISEQQLKEQLVENLQNVFRYSISV